MTLLKTFSSSFVWFMCQYKKVGTIHFILRNNLSYGILFRDKVFCLIIRPFWLLQKYPYCHFSVHHLTLLSSIFFYIPIIEHSAYQDFSHSFWIAPSYRLDFCHFYQNSNLGNKFKREIFCPSSLCFYLK